LNAWDDKCELTFCAAVTFLVAGNRHNTDKSHVLIDKHACTAVAAAGSAESPVSIAVLAMFIAALAIGAVVAAMTVHATTILATVTT